MLFSEGMPALTKNVSEPWFTLIANGAKSVEGRLRKGDFEHVAPGQTILWTNDELGFTRRCKTEVASVKEYLSFEAYLRGEGIARCLPTHGLSSVARGVQVYRKFYDKAAEKRHGIVAIRLRRR